MYPVKKRSINLISLGCSKNLVDSEKILGQLPASQYQIMHDSGNTADIIVVNTCGFIQDAKQESIDTILNFAEARRTGEVQRLFVIGCLSQRYKEALQAEIPEVDAWFGVDEPHKLFTQLKHGFDERLHARYLTTPAHYAYLKVSEGCDRSCSFCAIPLIRGGYRSASIEALTSEAIGLADAGVRELILVAQDLSHYGRDIKGRSMLVELLRSLLAIKKIEWIRLHYLYPQGFPDDLIRLMREESRICNYLDMPLQHINNDLLKSMRRGHDKEGTVRLIRRLREQIPGLAIRTTMLVGYPTETAESFEELKTFISDMRFERLGVFTYSAEEGTRAYGLEDSLTDIVKRSRADELMALQQGISLEINQSRVGSTLRVVIDREESEHFICRTEFDSPEVDNEVLLPLYTGLQPGDFVDVKIISASEYDLHAELL